MGERKHMFISNYGIYFDVYIFLHRQQFNRENLIKRHEESR